MQISLVLLSLKRKASREQVICKVGLNQIVVFASYKLTICRNCGSRNCSRTSVHILSRSIQHSRNSGTTQSWIRHQTSVWRSREALSFIQNGNRTPREFWQSVWHSKLIGVLSLPSIPSPINSHPHIANHVTSSWRPTEISSLYKGSLFHACDWFY